MINRKGLQRTRCSKTNFKSNRVFKRFPIRWRTYHEEQNKKTFHLTLYPIFQNFKESLRRITSFAYI